MDLNSAVSELPFVGPIYQTRLEKLGIKKIEDLLNHVPNRYLDFSLTSPIERAQFGETLTIRGRIDSFKNIYTKSGKKMQLAEISDNTGKILAIWFNQPFLTRILYESVEVSLAGKIDWFDRKRALISPEYEIVSGGKETIHTGKIISIYPETAGISSKWLRSRIKQAFDKVKDGPLEFLPSSILKKEKFPEVKTALEYVHFPSDLTNAGQGKNRLAFNELLFLQLESIQKRIDWQKIKTSNKLIIDDTSMNRFIESLTFSLTLSQKTAVKEILDDLKRDYPMNRLLEGDVGSGKTVVAAIAAFVAFANGCQTIFMAPTQILAQQHFDTLNQMLHPFKVRINLITSEVTKAELGRADIFVGTHALIHRKIGFEKTALVVIDEQHRFGVEQRAHLIKKAGKKSQAPHVLTMTATPIPRTVALTFYGDLDLSTLNELPLGRKRITTWIVPPQKRDSAYLWIEKQIKKEGIQAFVVCPLIEESEKETMAQVKAASKEFEILEKSFQTLKFGLLHGRLKSQEKNKILDEFRDKKIDILVTTPVVEVGIDVPNATIMVIEGAERFGLAQLHQLRGRVGRSDKKSYCLIFTQGRSQKSLTVLSALTKNLSGFELAELDLKLRGPGEIFGTAQSGFPELKIASWSDFELIRKAKETAEDAFENPSEYSMLFAKLQKMQQVSN